MIFAEEKRVKAALNNYTLQKMLSIELMQNLSKAF